MRIARVAATPLEVPVTLDAAGIEKKLSLSVCLAEVETDTGLVGHGFTAITEEEVVAAAINEVIKPNLTGENPLAHERIWEKLYWLLSPRGQTGYAAHAIAALDVALWDLKGKQLGQPVWRLLGGARSKVPVYTTFGFGAYSRDELAAAAKWWHARGHRRLKMVVGHHGLQRRDEPRPLDALIAEDARRVRAVREAIGMEADLHVDANCSLDTFHAARLARSLEEFDLSFFEEPVKENDVSSLLELKKQTTIPLAAGQNEGLAWRFRDLMVSRAIDIVQPNVVIGGGFTQCLRIAGMASAFNLPMANGGAWAHHNMHLHAGLANGGLVEYHYPAVTVCEAIYGPLAAPVDGWLELPEAPGLGFEPDRERVKDLAKRPTSRGRGKA
ncbi:MAG TPA: mandelate racemase/muconate lactonizing enzyme family protein [Burkholderiales bacterium]|nr:mandelate racemase/muconate lactonizing enzyme family protein [Burkholderiales bacterium]